MEFLIRVYVFKGNLSYGTAAGVPRANKEKATFLSADLVYFLKRYIPFPKWMER